MAMQRCRRLASVAVAAAVAMTGLSACRTEPGVAAYLDTGDISVKRVQQVYDDARVKHTRDAAKQAATGDQTPPGAPAADQKLPLTGENVLDTLVSHTVLVRAAERHHVQIPSPLPLQDYANLLKLPADSEYLRLYVEVEGLQFVLSQKPTGASISDADLRDIYDRARAQNAVDPATTFQAFADGLSADGKKTLGAAVALRNEMRDDITRQHIRLNPRFQPFDVPVLTRRGQDGSALVLVAAPVGDSSGAAPVTDAR
jgi:hypothetical protein